MAKARMASGLLAGCLILWGGAGPAAAQTKDAPTVAQMLAYKPRQAGVVCSTPTPEEQASCKVVLENGSRPGAKGWVLLDGQGRKLRRFFDSQGNRNVDVYSYYKDGVEVYREIDTNKDRIPDQFRWLNSGGMKWGVDVNADGKIDAWRMISAEEVAHEIFLATAARDFNRLKSLFINDRELQWLKLPAAKATKIQQKLANAAKKFETTIAKLPALTKDASFVRVESAAPQCAPADTVGSEQDIIKFSDRVILYQGTDKKHEWLHTGGMVQVGLAWRLLDAPGMEDLTPPPDGAKVLIEKLAELDKTAPAATPAPGENLQAASYYKQRVALLEQILAKTTGSKDSWYRQIAENYSTLAQCGAKADKAAAKERLSQLVAELTRSQASSALVPCVTFREIWATYGEALANPDTKDMVKVQEKYLEALSKFVQQFPKADDAADALMQLGMGREFTKEDEAKRWYQQLVTNFPNHPLTTKARGCIRRLDLIGQPLELTAPTLSGQQYNIASARGKVVVVYYWNKDCGACVGDFARLKELQQKYAAKGLEIVGVSLDDRAEDAKQFLQSHPLPVHHLFQSDGQATGLAGPLAIQYGIMTMPNLFLVGKDGKVISRTVQINDLEDAIKKAL